MNTNDIKKNSIVEIEITELSNQGLGVAKINGLAILIEDALVGESGTVRIHRVENTFALGEWDKQAVKSKDRVEVTAKNKVLTNIIPLIHLNYDKQLEFKTGLVKEAFSKLDGFNEECVVDTIGMENKWHYRNKAQIHVQANKDTMETGVISRRPSRMIPVDNFKVNLPGVDEIIAGVRDVLINFNEKGYNPKTNTGNIRQIIVRKGYATDQVMVIIVTRSKSLFPVSKIVPEIVERFPNVVGIVHSVNNDKNNQGMGGDVEVIHNEPTYQDIILNNTFDIGASSYFKGNTIQAEVLTSSLIDLLDLQGDEVVLDANSGVGVVALSLANKVKSVLGIDRFAENVELAKTNASNNKISNVTFDTVSVPEAIESLSTLDIVIVDPSSRGLNTHLIEAITKATPSKIAYISTDLTSLVKDVAAFTTLGYEITKIVPVDMLPQTTLVEVVVLLSKVKK
jgi:23S rRNA (uracil1939-C5)-methyltransferase